MVEKKQMLSPLPGLEGKEEISQEALKEVILKLLQTYPDQEWDVHTVIAALDFTPSPGVKFAVADALLDLGTQGKVDIIDQQK